MKNIIVFVQIILSIFLMAAILLQSKGQGLSTSFGGGGEYYSSKRGVEKILFWATIIICVLFAITSILVLIL